MRRWTLLLLCTGLALILPTACNAGKAKLTSPPPSTADADLKNLSDVYHLLAHENRPPPAGLLDLHEFSGGVLQESWARLENGDYVVFWGAGRATDSRAVLVYEKQVPEQGGVVLLQDGTVTKMTPAEFQAAPKAGS